MQRKKLKLCVMLLSFIAQTGMNAQTTLHLKEKSGTQASFTLSSINKLTFADGNMTVNMKGGAMNAFALSNVRSIDFINATSIEKIWSVDNMNLMFYPNPVIDQLRIRYESTISEEVHLQIIDVQGKIVYQKTLRSQIGSNYSIISVVQLKPGLYFCKLQNGNEQGSCKLLKE